ncbi:DUF6577 family protein [Flavobacterium terrisoli]|uniref:DUF6577 family protein n=1 Tax=Flavobacterium terrisoli TaxID=3242195 RepID=UPI002542E31F|nr:DUF6577 family protein [Flavobacterium buctense]
MDKTLENKLVNYFEQKDSLSRMDLIEAIHEDYPSWTQSTITVYMSKLTKAGKLRRPYRGMYTLSLKKVFHPEITPSLKKMYNKVHREYPFVNCCVWDSRWLNSFMRHQPFKQYIIIEVEKDVLSQAFNSINESNKNVFLNPDSNIFDYYISNVNEAIIIKPLVSEAPVNNEGNIVIPSLEKLLVDMLTDKDLFAAQQGEIEDIFLNAFEKYAINESRMKRYAIRRNRENEVIDLLNLISAK